MALILISSERFAEHQTPPGHPECPERADVMDVIATEWRRQGGEVVAPPLATHEQLARVHDPAYLERIAGAAGRATVLDPDTYTSSETSEIARLAAGAAVDAVERVMGKPHLQAIALVRPPGHHAERARAMGFCIYNNIAVAAAHAGTLGAQRVAIVDYDVHHGNGTQHMFESRPDMLYISTHQFPYYPGTGAADEIGRGPGEGFTINVPISVGAADADYQLVFSDVVTPVLRQFNPDRVGRIRRPRTRSARRHATDRWRIRGDDHGASAGGGRVLRGKDGDGDGGRLRLPGIDRIVACRRVGAVARPRGGARLADIRCRVAVARPYSGRRREGGAWAPLEARLTSLAHAGCRDPARPAWARRPRAKPTPVPEHPEVCWLRGPPNAKNRRSCVSGRIGEG